MPRYGHRTEHLEYSADCAVQWDAASVLGGLRISPCRSGIPTATRPGTLPALSTLIGPWSFRALGEGVTCPCHEVTVRKTRVSVLITAPKFVHGIGFSTESIYTQARKCGQSVLATVSTMHYSASVQLFSIDQPHNRFLAVVDVARVTTSRDQSYGVRLQKEFAQYFLACGRDLYGLMKYVDISTCRNSRLNTRHACLTTMTTSGE